MWGAIIFVPLFLSPFCLCVCVCVRVYEREGERKEVESFKSFQKSTQNASEDVGLLWVFIF